MAYEIKFTDQINKGVILVEDNTINQETSLDLPGRSTTAYGTAVSENFLHLLENFAASSAPRNPVEGQLWYDNTAGVDQLKIYDGTNWVASGGLKKGDNEPAVSNSVAGDLWSDTTNQQLYMFTGTGWILVGPNFSDGLSTGATPSKILDSDNVEHSVILIEVDAQPLAIIASETFTPKTTINGFEIINPGLNLNSRDITGSGISKFIGTSEKAESLVVGNDIVTADKFLRSDVASTTNEIINIKNNAGLKIGEGAQFVLEVEGDSSVISNNFPGAFIDIRGKDGDRTINLIRIDPLGRIGINNDSPDEALDVEGNIKATGNLIINSTTQSSNFNTGSIKTLGGIGVAKNLNVGGDAKITGILTTQNVIPDINAQRNIGNELQRFDSVYAQNFVGNLVGNVSGTVTGRSGSADSLTSATTFRMQGDVSAPSFAFDGKDGGTTKTFTTAISNSFIANKAPVTSVNLGDELLLNKTGQGIFKVTAANLLRTIPTVPVGVILPYGGPTPPSGWLFCDGRIVTKSQYNELWNAIQHAFLDPDLLDDNGVNTFALPDMRGRFPLGLDNMGGSAAGRVTGTGATEVGNNLGQESTYITVDNLPEHEHDLRGDSGDQYYAMRDISGAPQDAEAIQYDAPTGTAAGQALPSSGGVAGHTELREVDVAGESLLLGAPLNIMNPYLALNYIIYHGVV